MSTSTPFPDLIRGARDRAGLLRLLGGLGFDPIPNGLPGPPEAYGLRDAPDVRSLAVVARAGSLDVLLLETAAGTGTERAGWLARRIRSRNPARLHLFVMATPRYRKLVLGTFGLDGTFRHLTLERDRIRTSDVEALEEMAARNGEAGLELAIRQARALDRSRVTRAFFRDFRGRRNAVADAWTGIPEEAVRERAQLALLFLSRLTFLYFLQKRGALAGDDRYLPRLFGRWSARPGEPEAGPGEPEAEEGESEAEAGGLARPVAGRSFFRTRLQPLFFGALNLRPEDRDAPARRLGPLPYLNGGLFEPHALERRFPDLDLPDPEVRACFDDLLERYRFTSREAGAGAGFGVDPEVLGRVFEGLMAPGARGHTGSFYTPAPVVNRIVREALATYTAGAVHADDAEAVIDGRVSSLPGPMRHRVRRRLERVRILDPACGSGAFLLGALQLLADALSGLSSQPEAEVRRDLVSRSIHGVDLLDDAALLCSLRLWLALSQGEDEVRPLPNLDRRIRQGDALVDPLDLGVVGADSGIRWHPLRDPMVRRSLRALEPAARAYLGSGPEERQQARSRVQEAEARLARSWIRGLEAAREQQLKRLKARAADRDLFGETPEAARAAEIEASRAEAQRRELEEVRRRLEEDGALPFFSFGVHFADSAAGFDVIVSNPPWVRSHRWPEHLRAVTDRFEVCRSPAWAAAAELTGAPAAGGAQVDLSLLFLERSLRLLAPGGVLALLLSAKTFRALYGGAARRMLLRDLQLVLIEDHALDQRAIFQADAFAGVLVARKTDGSPAAAGAGAVRVRLTRRGVDPLEFRLDAADLPLFPDDPTSPWLLAPPAVQGVLRRMQAAGPPLGRHDGFRVRRGVMTGANDVLIFPSVEPKLGGLARVEAEGARRTRRAGSGRAQRRYRAVVETAGLRPLVRGADVDAFRYEVSGHVVWCHDASGKPAEPGPGMQRYLEGHRSSLEARPGYRAGLPLGVVFRLGPETVGPKVVWHDLSDTLRAVALPATVRFDGADRELIPLNTVYFLPTPDSQTALVLAGLLNSLPVRTAARGVAERAKDARFRFFAWTVSSLPLPLGWRQHRATAAIHELSARAHERSGITPGDQRALDRAAAALYGLEPQALEPLESFDRWLRGEP